MFINFAAITDHAWKSFFFFCGESCMEELTFTDGDRYDFSQFLTPKLGGGGGGGEEKERN